MLPPSQEQLRCQQSNNAEHTLQITKSWERISKFRPAGPPADKVSEGGGLKEEGEDIEVVETRLQEAAAMIAAGEIVDAKTVVLIQYLSNRISVDAPG